jgi:hypothetical protein
MKLALSLLVFLYYAAPLLALSNKRFSQKSIATFIMHTAPSVRACGARYYLNHVRFLSICS